MVGDVIIKVSDVDVPRTHTHTHTHTHTYIYTHTYIHTHRSRTVMVGDVIIKVSDVDVRGRKKHEVLAMLKGRAGTMVKLTLKRANQIFDVSICMHTLCVRDMHMLCVRVYVYVHARRCLLCTRAGLEQ
jgi:hypothetical protein